MSYAFPAMRVVAVILPYIRYILWTDIFNSIICCNL